MTVWCEDHKRSDCPHELTKLVDGLAAENDRLTKQLRIATETLEYLSRAAGYGKSARHMSTMAEGGLRQIFVVE